MTVGSIALSGTDTDSPELRTFSARAIRVASGDVVCTGTSETPFWTILRYADWPLIDARVSTVGGPLLDGAAFREATSMSERVFRI